ncbi:TetR/AcrR family transcriptional regulator [Corallococcus praedator]|uniref:TetR/AcrR family transcriptional regulator n=1 Tax=Corallococcus praedator TaxID=2316724 RepID=A0ABX9QAQ2_9BACT|nr:MULTISPECIES: TetR/AcrR family transcriptional regulator [Corallococcus]RKH33267.1 TetR/AcrR family transcriptional regulator [Corallococcus sp. CA031C]RKH95127.1 TetR/AcrR family transcriptional regulator [Corallococcus praedator]
MTQKPRAPESALVWERPEPTSRPAPGPLSRERIVHAALELADAEGLASVSLRKVAAALDAGPMRLYGYLSTKEELLELMVDAVYGEMVSAGPIRGAWREALRSIAHRTRQAAAKHPWLIDLLVGRPHLGPNALAHLEASLAALSNTPGFKDDIDAVMQAVGTVNAYVVGALRSEASEQRATLESGMNKTQWQNATEPYIRRMIDTGRFPTLARVFRDATHPSFEVVFDKGLDCVLDGIAARLAR